MIWTKKFITYVEIHGYCTDYYRLLIKHLYFLAISPFLSHKCKIKHYTATTTCLKTFFRKQFIMGEPTHTTSKQRKWNCLPHLYWLLPEKWSVQDASLPAMFNPLYYSSMNQQQFEKSLCNKSSHYENYRLLLLSIEAVMCLLQNFAMKKMNGTQREPTKNALYIQWYGKRLKQCQTTKQKKSSL